jgi:hypothetical protein
LRYGPSSFFLSCFMGIGSRVFALTVTLLFMLPAYLGWQTCATTLKYLLRWGGPTNFLPRLASNWDLPNFCLLSS